MTAVWIEVLDIAGVPAEFYEACYTAAMQRRTELKAEGKELNHLTAEDLAVEWVKIRKLNADIDRSHLLPTNAAAACQRCFSTGFERMPDRSVRPNCQHEPMTDEEEREIERNRVADAEFVQNQAAIMREALKTIGNPKPVVEDVKPRQSGTILKCDSCPRKVNTLFGFEVGDKCGDLLNRGTHEGELKFCEGKFQRLESHTTNIAEDSPAGAESAFAFTITAGVRQQLYDLGYSSAEVDGMKPEGAQAII